MNAADSAPVPAGFSGLDLLSSAVILLDGRLLIRYLNPAAENLFAVSQRAWLGRPLVQLAGTPPALDNALDNVLANNWSYTAHDVAVTCGGGGDGRGGEPLHVDCTVTPVHAAGLRLLLEFRPIDQQLKAIREEREVLRQQASQELIRNLAHEIKNPLGGIRGSAQLLEHELAGLDNAPALKEYTQVIIREADRLQDLMRRLLSSHRAMQPVRASIHDLIERVCRLIDAEYPEVCTRRDYDISLPEITGDREQLIQAILNIARNAAQAMHGRGEIVFRTRALRQATLGKRRHRLALELQVIDNGPGIPEAIRDKIFYPLVSGRQGGSGLGLALAQSIVQRHSGSLEVNSVPGRTCFTVRLPLTAVKEQEMTT
jgi:two-component system nitrogen regulation sensor histidine kinase GlnL